MCRGRGALLRACGVAAKQAAAAGGAAPASCQHERTTRRRQGAAGLQAQSGCHPLAHAATPLCCAGVAAAPGACQARRAAVPGGPAALRVCDCRHIGRVGHTMSTWMVQRGAPWHPGMPRVIMHACQLRCRATDTIAQKKTGMLQLRSAHMPPRSSVPTRPRVRVRRGYCSLPSGLSCPAGLRAWSRRSSWATSRLAPAA